MQRIFNEDELKLLRSLSKFYTLQKLGDFFGCTAMTVHNWTRIDEVVRVDKFKYKRAGLYGSRFCDCGESVKIHKRCKNCTMLIHGDLEYCTDNCQARYNKRHAN